MLRIISDKCTDILIKHGAIQGIQRPVFQYGFELFWSTFLGIVSICLFGAAGGYLHMAVTFLLYFMPIRMAVGGYHAKTYGRCFLMTNLISFGTVITTWIAVRCKEIEVILWIGYGLAFWHIWRFAPVKSKKNPQREEALLKRRRMGHKIVCLEIISICGFYLLGYKDISYMAMATSCAVAVMMLKAEGRERHGQYLGHDS